MMSYVMSKESKITRWAQGQAARPLGGQVQEAVDESLRAFVPEFRVGRSFAFFGCPEGGAIDVNRTRLWMLWLPGACERRL